MMTTPINTCLLGYYFLSQRHLFLRLVEVCAMQMYFLFLVVDNFPVAKTTRPYDDLNHCAASKPTNYLYSQQFNCYCSTSTMLIIIIEYQPVSIIIIMDSINYYCNSLRNLYQKGATFVLNLVQLQTPVSFLQGRNSCCTF